jgi:hypothetical protein
VSDYVRNPQPPPRRDKVLADAMQTFSEEDAPQTGEVGAEQELVTVDSLNLRIWSAVSRLEGKLDAIPDALRHINRNLEKGK